MTNNFASKEEQYFQWWLEELKTQKFIEKYEYESKGFELNKGVNVKYETGVRVIKEKQKTIIPVKIYTPDFFVIWTDKAKDIFMFDINEKLNYNPNLRKLIPACVNDYNKYISYIEVKPNFDMQNMTRLVKTNIAVVWDKYNVYIHIVKPVKLFFNTFVPKRYYYTDNGFEDKKLRLVNKKPVKDTAINLNKYYETFKTT